MTVAIVDSHHHIWRQADLPWLAGPMQPRIFGPYEEIRRDYLIDEFRADLAGTGVAKSVYVQANWPVDRFAAEASWVQGIADQYGWPHAIVGYADFSAADVRPQLDALAAYPLMRGVRMQLHWHDNAMYRFAQRADLAADPQLQRNIAHLADYGWCFELQVFAGQMPNAVKLADACPDVTFVLQHAGMLEDLSPAGRRQWADGMAALAHCPNVVSKLSGLGTFIHRNDADHIRDIVGATLDWFGPQRCMFGSNFPIEKLWTSYDALIAAHRSALADRGPAVEAAVLQTTAERIYRLGET